MKHRPALELLPTPRLISVILPEGDKYFQRPFFLEFLLDMSIVCLYLISTTLGLDAG